MYGIYLSPKLGIFMNMLTSYIIPAAFAGTMGSIGLACGCAACVGSFGEALRQFVTEKPYSMPVSCMLIEWLPKG
ncbi:MAG: hypothetical protein EBQ96_06000 [Proteobacteria bacterium]|nr:hypothetical protein [Pseudomonadota bacterium]